MVECRLLIYSTLLIDARSSLYSYCSHARLTNVWLSDGHVGKANAAFCRRRALIIEERIVSKANNLASQPSLLK
jgi:hypothetical protein